MARPTLVAFVLFSVLVSSSACGGDDFEPRQTELQQTATGNFEIIVSNQSFEIDAVDVEVFVDGELAISDVFEVGSQHTFVSHTFDVSPGSHTLSAVTQAGVAEITVSFDAETAKRWGVLMYWFYPDPTSDPTPRQFTFSEHDEQPAFD